MSKPVVTLVVPCYNEEEILPHTIDVLHALIKEYIEGELISDRSRILFVDDGSSDSTWQLMDKASIHRPLSAVALAECRSSKCLISRIILS